MSRKPVTIDMSKCKSFRFGLKSLARRFDFEGKIIYTAIPIPGTVSYSLYGGFVGLKGDMKRFVETFLKEDTEAGILVFAQGFSHTPDELAQIEYLKGLLK